MGGQRLSTARERDHHLTGTVRRGGAVSLGDGNPNGFLACGFIRELSGGKPDGYPSGFGMGRIGKGDCRHFPPGERCTGDYVDLDHSCRGVYWNEPPPL